MGCQGQTFPARSISFNSPTKGAGNRRAFGIQNKPGALPLHFLVLGVRDMLLERLQSVRLGVRSER